MALHNQLGIFGEREAATWLDKHGYTILEKNWRFKKAEVDLIALYENTLILVEVKTRSTDYYGPPEISVSVGKQKMLCLAAQAYLEEKKLNVEIRFDIISIITRHNGTRISHIPNAFYPFSSELDY